MRYYLSCIIFFVCSALFAQDPVKSLVDKLADSYLENGNGELVLKLMELVAFIIMEKKHLTKMFFRTVPISLKLEASLKLLRALFWQIKQ